MPQIKNFFEFVAHKRDTEETMGQRLHFLNHGNQFFFLDCQ